jgi:hypothetical protein
VRLLFVQGSGGRKKPEGIMAPQKNVNVLQGFSINKTLKATALAIVKLLCNPSYWSYWYLGLERRGPLLRNY